MVYYLCVIGCHQKTLPKNIIKMLINFLVFSHFVYGLPCVCCLGPSLSVNLLHRLHNRGVRMTSGLCKYDHVSHYKFVIGWLPVSLLFSIAHLSLCISSIGVITAYC